ncbi:UvrB/UvrC motif-containing protein [uncultured Oscillibacter sp.]|uniref:UvrB/UvrC motif-containing protein n=1 Tax=uncultured Oscillibacter sp. TaxID=876091 RepID=UPI0025F34C09|nr:UvrB/UvrC motif-containing protein [uncultured Oscillibacter sp.]
MKCENCGKNEVTFVYQSNVNGHVTEKHLCADCAAKLGYTQKLAAQSQRMMQGFFGGGLLEDFFTPYPSLLSRMNRMLEDPFDDFFADMPALGAPVEQRQEAQKSPDTLLEGAEQNQLAKTRQLNALRMEMQKAVGEENFERAAELRDQIHALEQN